MSALLEQNKKVLQFIGLSVFFLAILSMAYYLRSIFNPVLLSLLLAYILNPIANLFEKWKVRRTMTISLIYLCIIAVLALLFLLIIPLIGAEISYLYEKTFVGDAFEDKNANGLLDEGERIFRDIDKDGKFQASYVEVIILWLKDVIKQWNELHPENKIEWQFIVERLTSDKESIKEMGQTVFSLSKGTIVATLKTLVSLFSLLSYLVLLPLYTFFLLRNLNDIQSTVYRYFPKKQKPEITRILRRIHLAVSGFFRGKLIICLVKGFLTWGCLALLGVRYSLIFGGIQAIASIVPFLVLLVGMIPNLVIFLVDAGLKWPQLAGILLIYTAIECLETFLLTPWIMGKETELHPLTIILTLVIGGNLFGLFGLIIAIPLCTTLKILGQEFILPAWKDLAHCEEEPEENSDDTRDEESQSDEKKEENTEKSHKRKKRKQ